MDTQAARAQPAPPADAPVSPPPAGMELPPTPPQAPPPAGEGIDPEEKAPRSFHLSRQVLERARAAAQYLSRQPGADGPTTISELVERALRRELERLELEHNGGLPFPAVHGRMRTGPGAAGAERIRRAQRARHRSTEDG